MVVICHSQRTQRDIAKSSLSSVIIHIALGGSHSPSNATTKDFLKIDLGYVIRELGAARCRLLGRHAETLRCLDNIQYIVRLNTKRKDHKCSWRFLVL
jgi:hypothetical protein